MDGEVDAFDVVIRDVTLPTFVDRAARALHSNPDPMRALEALAAVLRDRMDLRTFALGHVEGDSLRWVAAVNGSAVAPDGTEPLVDLPLDDPPTLLVVPDTARADRPFDQRLRAAGIGSYILHAIARDGRLVACYLLGFSSPGEARTHWRLFDAIASNLGQIVHTLLAFQTTLRAMDRLRELDAMKGDFVSMVAHDLRNPLTVIDGAAQLLTEHWDKVEPEQREDLVRRIRERALFMSDLVTDILDVGVIEGESLSVDRQPFDVRVVLQQAVDDARTTDPDATITFRSPVAECPATGDARRVAQVMQNLIGNAVKFSRPDPHVEVVLEARDGGWHVTVHDDGAGIPPEYRARLFGRFSRIPGRDRSIPGTGLGLYITKLLVDAMGGTIAASDGPAGGAAFAVWLPANPDPA